MYKWNFNIYNFTSELSNKCIIAFFSLTFVIFITIIGLSNFISFLTTKKDFFFLNSSPMHNDR